MKCSVSLCEGYYAGASEFVLKQTLHQVAYLISEITPSFNVHTVNDATVLYTRIYCSQ